MIPGNAVNFDKPWLLLCEGLGDQRFFYRLFEAHQIGGDFVLRYPHKDGRWGGGRSSFGADLLNASVNEDFITNVKAILVVSDKDEDPDKSFAEVQAELRKANLPVPTEERTVAKAKDKPSIVVLMLPMNGNGNLETLCLEPAYDKWKSWDAKSQIDTLVDNSPPKKWGKSKQSKMRIQVLLAATNDSQPDTGFTGHWNQPDKFQIPVNHACFNELIDFLNRFPTIVAA